MRRIVVVGSLNMDTVIETSHMPKCGETVVGKNIMQIPGGKGANQAYAAGKLGGNVAMIGAVGRDSSGAALLESLKSVGVDVSKIEKMKHTTTGQAFITVDDQGDNSIIIISGANGKVTTELIDKNKDIICGSDIVILQLEIPLEVVQYAKELAVKEKKLVIVDPAPAVKGIPDTFWEEIDYIKPNETELEILTGLTTKNEEETIKAAKSLLEKGVKNVLVTLGGTGCMHVSKEGSRFYKANKVKAVDTTAAGDCFTAAFALALSQGKNCRDAIEFGQKASAIAVMRKGAQTSIPTAEEMR